MRVLNNPNIAVSTKKWKRVNTKLQLKMSAAKNIYYSDKYTDEAYEYR